MRNSFTIDVDATALKATLLRLDQIVKPFIKVASKISADHICADAKARLLRQLSGTSTGKTVAGIVVKSDRTGWGWIVDAGNTTTPMLDHWLESGTARMAARPFFYASAQLEAQAHRERIQAALHAALSEQGLGG